MCESASAHKVPAVHRVIRRAWLGGLGRNSEQGHQRKLPSLQWQLCPHFWTCFLPWTPWPSPTVLWCLLSCSQPLGHNTCLLEDASSCEAAWGSSSSPVFHCYLISHIIIFHCVVRSLITDKINLIFKIFFPNFYCHQLLLSSTLHIRRVEYMSPPSPSVELTSLLIWLLKNLYTILHKFNSNFRFSFLFYNFFCLYTWQ